MSTTRSKTTLDRTTFQTSREMDFFSEKELTTQTGHSIQEWPYVILKELIDNALDACEQADIPPVIEVVADNTGISVRDNGPCLPESTLAGVLDFTVRASNREQYVAPDRGAQGNALMTLVTMPYVIDQTAGKFIVEAHGTRHEITAHDDPISQRAVVDDDTSEIEEVPGTLLQLEWAENIDNDGDVVWPFDDMCPLVEQWGYGDDVAPCFLNLFRGYAFFNPHATLTLDWFGEVTKFEATDPAWNKWAPNKPTSPHWYEPRHLERLIAAYITHHIDNGTDRTVADFLKEFDGLTGSKKRKEVLAETGLARVNLSELATSEGLKSDVISKLLESMKSHTKEVAARRLGIIGQDHFKIRLEEIGGDPEQFQYTKVARVDTGIPFVLESAFSWMGDGAPNKRHIFAGANWSPGISNPFRSFGNTGEGLESVLGEQRAGRSEPIVFLLHLAHPRVEYKDRGKSSIVLDGKESEE